MDHALTQSKKEEFLSLLKKYWLFFAAFALMAVYLKLCGPMTNVSGDAASIWETIKSFHSGEIVPSYVMYKGFASVYPYVWLYDLSVFFGVGEFFFVKLYHCALFAYISAVGFPYLMQKLLKIDHKTWRKALLVVVLFLFWRYTRVFNQLMVDLPSLAYFLMLLNSALKLNVQKTLRCVGRYLYTGLLVGLNMCISGQYSAAAWCVVLYVLIKTVPWRFLKDGAKRAGALLCAAVLIVSFAAVRFCNIKFEENVIDPLRAEGAWIPTGETWLQISFMRRLGVARNGNGVEIPDNRGLAIAKDLFGDEYEEKYEQMVKGEIQLTIGDYFKLAAKYPMDFITRYVNRLFLIISPDDGGLHIIPLFFAYTFLFVSLLVVMKHCRTVKQFFSPNLLLILSFFLAVAALIVANVEIRCALQLQGLIFSAAILDDTLWNGIKSFAFQIKECAARRTLKILGAKPFPYTFLIYLGFMLLCFTHIAALYEFTGIQPGTVLFTW